MAIFARESAGPPAEPGRWYGQYHDDWERDHPGLWVRGEAQCGSFYADNTWAGSTLDWDREWFAAHGMSMPRKYAYRLDPVGGVRIGTLQPGESVTVVVAPIAREDP
ncbi:hypothetical protein [Nocardia sp. NPDC057030]|uniref:hypothetical protein n=1 Tax=unclassified Nocardia TaxID=2637762 RepID=UPI003642CA67